jgi:hypothetical protein
MEKQKEFMTKEPNPMSIERAFTFFIVPFYFDTLEDWNAILSKLDRWKAVNENLYNKEDVLYPYIMDLFQQKGISVKQKLSIYKFTPCKEQFDAPEGRFAKTLFAERILGKQSMAYIGKNAEEKKNPQTILFTLMNEGNMAPHLFISPSSQIGIMTFCIRLDDTKNMESIKVLNYYLHKRDERDKYLCVCPEPENQKKKNLDVAIEVNKIFKSTPDFWKLNQGKTRFNEDFLCWCTDDLVNCMLATLGQPKPDVPRIKYFSRDRIHLFTFCSMQDVENKITSECLYPDMMRLARCVENSYMLPFNQMLEQGHFLEAYENIYFSSAIEGASMVCVGKEGNSEFIKQIHNRFSRQYLIVYLLVLIQRFTLLRLEQMMTSFEFTKKNKDDDLWKLINIICRIKVNCYYTDVSVYTHYSQFYQFCCRNLLIDQTFQEVGEKADLLKMTTERNLQKIQEKSERLQKLLNIIVAILTIAQVMQAVNEMKNTPDDINWALWAGGICIVLIFACYLWAYFKDSMSIFSNNNNQK